jgi:hypothetical protein
MNDRFPARFVLLFSLTTAAALGAATTTLVVVSKEAPPPHTVTLKEGVVLTHAHLWFSSR